MQVNRILQAITAFGDCMRYEMGYIPECVDAPAEAPYQVEHLCDNPDYTSIVRIWECPMVLTYCILEHEGYKVLHLSQASESWTEDRVFTMALVQRRVVEMGSRQMALDLAA